jgi:hypothetical protein
MTIPVSKGGIKPSGTNILSTQRARGDIWQGGKHSKQQTAILKKWLKEHLENPYLKLEDKSVLSQKFGQSKKQVQNWLTNMQKVSI